MRRAVIAVLALGCAVMVSAAVFERYLNPDKPMDRAILAYYALAESGKATSRDLAELGVLLLEKGFPDDAERYLRKALEVDQHNFEAAYRLGLVLQRMGRDREAIGLYRSVVKERPGHAYARFMLALAEERSGRIHAAVQDYAKAYRFRPELGNPMVNPLVLDSELQPQAQLLHYREAKLAATLEVDAIDPAAVKRMMEVKPAPPVSNPPSAAPTPKPTPAVTGAKPTPGPVKVTAPAAAPQKAPAGQGAPPAPATPKKATATQAPPASQGMGGTPMFGVPNVSGTAAVRLWGDSASRTS